MAQQRGIDQLQRGLECPICFEDYGEREIYQCTNGHVLCDDCIRKCSRLCPICQTAFPKRRIRNRALEFMASNKPAAEAEDAESPPTKKSKFRKTDATHVGFTCDSLVCKTANRGAIRAVRFKCIECPNFNLCRDCVLRAHRQHLFIRIANPVQAPVADRVVLAPLVDEEITSNAPANTSFFSKIGDRVTHAFRSLKLKRQ